jgi:ATP-dependent DNA ligase
VGSGFNASQRQAMLEQLSQSPTHQYSVSGAPSESRWIPPRLRARIRYFEITKDQKLRSPVFEHFVGDD